MTATSIVSLFALASKPNQKLINVILVGKEQKIILMSDKGLHRFSDRWDKIVYKRRTYKANVHEEHDQF